MALTQDEIRIISNAYALRHDEEVFGRELWFAGQDVDLPVCHRLVERGYLDRSWHTYRSSRRLGPVVVFGKQRRDIVYRLSDQAMTAQEFTRLGDPSAGSLN
jgi:hypothetical protein